MGCGKACLFGFGHLYGRTMVAHGSDLDDLSVWIRGWKLMLRGL
jgi:hypothetical protein